MVIFLEPSCVAFSVEVVEVVTVVTVVVEVAVEVTVLVEVVVVAVLVVVVVSVAVVVVAVDVVAVAVVVVVAVVTVTVVVVAVVEVVSFSWQSAPPPPRVALAPVGRNTINARAVRAAFDVLAQSALIDVRSTRGSSKSCRALRAVLPMPTGIRLGWRAARTLRCRVAPS